jgi:hypothetical protein
MRQEGEYVLVVAGYHCARVKYCRAEGNGKDGTEDVRDGRVQYEVIGLQRP